ncbi:hypothetical protein BWQ96_08558 [Gracilariopsis chorda]|uniref:DNA methylase N-4/N-6 domain-containing protein n=1 Tax=Gracilariopsis chorda TaxID=448386 RepID=A0A2V3II63_9FLOR|nr:hypothetical protein BWQ96_08558 [Gracilariopsis chorda]|eukprot:PXF41728.1 hypothetical protein BWQ96_08558 [Gracilariopsis chorda]
MVEDAERGTAERGTAPKATQGLQTTALSQNVWYDVEGTGIRAPPYPTNLDDVIGYKYCEKEMSRNFRLHNCKFEHLIEVDHNKSGESEVSIEGRVQFLLSDPPYGTRSERRLENSEHDILTEKGMSRSARSSSTLLRPGGHIIPFCSWDQVPLWRDVLRKVTYMDDSDTMRYSLVIDEQPLHFVRSLGNSTGNVGRRSCRLHQTTEYAVHAVCAGVPYAQQHWMVNCENFHYVASRYPAYHAIMDQVPPISNSEMLMWSVKNLDGKYTRKRVRPEQKCRALLNELICWFSQPGDLVVGMFAGTFSTPMAWM